MGLGGGGNRQLWNATRTTGSTTVFVTWPKARSSGSSSRRSRGREAWLKRQQNLSANKNAHIKRATKWPKKSEPNNFHQFVLLSRFFLAADEDEDVDERRQATTTTATIDASCGCQCAKREGKPIRRCFAKCVRG